jgi:hypothetical protein
MHGGLMYNYVLGHCLNLVGIGLGGKAALTQIYKKNTTNPDQTEPRIQENGRNWIGGNHPPRKTVYDQHINYDEILF